MQQYLKLGANFKIPFAHFVSRFHVRSLFSPLCYPNHSLQNIIYSNNELRKARYNWEWQGWRVVKLPVSTCRVLDYSSSSTLGQMETVTGHCHVRWM